MSRFTDGRICSACPAAICNENRSGFCRKCYRSWIGHKHLHLLKSPENEAKRLARLTETNKRRAAEMRSWCPEGMWGEYRRLVRNRRIKSPQAKQIILAKHIATLSPFERQLHAIQNGARLVANDTKPMFGQVLSERKWA